MPKLTGRVDVPFELCFRYKLAKGYTFSNLEKKDLKSLQGFLDKVSNMTVNQVDIQYGRKPDKSDTYNGMQVYHYGVTDAFRVHVISENGHYVVIRIDPRHSIH